MDLNQLKTGLKVQFIRYLNQHGIETIKQAAQDFKEDIVNGKAKMHKTIYCPIYINVTWLNELSGWFCNTLLQEPRLVQKVVQELVLLLISTELDDQYKFQLNQIFSPIVIYPSTVSDIKLGLCQLKGIIVEHTDIQKYSRTSAWKCTDEGCSITDDPIVSKGLPTNPPLCSKCAAPLQEILGDRNYGNWYSIRLINKNYLSFTPPSELNEWKRVDVQDDRVCKTDIELGAEYSFVGIQNEEFFEAWGCEKQTFYPTSSLQQPSIDYLQHGLANNPWAFVETLSNVIGASYYPHGEFMCLRKGLLLSITCAGRYTPVPILAISEDTLIAQRLMEEAAALAVRCTRPDPAANLGGFVKKEWRSAGSLILAKGGICYLGHWYSYNNKRGLSILKAIETGRISLKGNNDTELPLHCAVWTYWEKPTKTKNNEQLQTLLKVFGLGWPVEICDENVEAVVDHILSPVQKSLNITKTEVKNYIAAVNTINVEISEPALQLLKNYFVGTRYARGGILPLTSLDPLIALTEAHSRLNRRSVALYEDALAAVELCERALGPCGSLSTPPKDMWEFKNWLNDNVLNTDLVINEL